MRKLLAYIVAIVAVVALMAPAAASAAVQSGTSNSLTGGSTTAAMYRLYNPNSGEHFYTASSNERMVLVHAGWRPEGVGWIAPTNTGTNVYRLYNPNSGDHHYTTTAGERDQLVVVGWIYEGVGWRSSDSKGIPVYRLYNPNAETSAHHYTTSAGERDWLASLGWIYEGVGWYAAGMGYEGEDWVSLLNVAKKTNEIITVEAAGTRATVILHKKVNGEWRQVLRTDDGWVGEQGLGPAREGASYTPTGVMWPDKAFGIKPNPGCPMGYLQVDQSHYWVGDSYSSLYNQLVSTRDRTDFNPAAGEHLASMGSAYNYCLNMGWNKQGTPHGGSCFFLHCSTGRPTGGCVSVPESFMIQILQNIHSGCAIVIGNSSTIMMN